MLDIKEIRNDPERVKKGMRVRHKEIDIDAVLRLDDLRRSLILSTDAEKSEQNQSSKQIPVLKKEGKQEEAQALLARMKELSDDIKENDAKLRETEEALRAQLLSIPNVPHESVPEGQDDSENVEKRRFGTPRDFGFEPQAHWDIGAKLGILDPERAAKVTGARFHFYKGLGARLERAVINYFLNTHTANGYTEILPPFLVNRASMTGTGQLPKFEDDAFHIDKEDLFLIPTAEVPVTNFHRDEILDGAQLPIKYCAYSACFREEAGSAGRDTRGLIRQHQFNKVELVKFVRPEDSYEELEKLTGDAERVLQGLGLPYHVVTLCAGDLGFSSAKTYDIEVWMPSYGRYVEISSCSNFEDYQARRASIRFKDGARDKTRFVHTLNGSGVAIGRTVAAILENYQNEDGSVTVPEVLRGLMGVDVIPVPNSAN
ncbi:serine--tRNA ligase [Ethanoligenens harbinense]|uniref:Serine--tRNA ligase n=1 Tax=Ethanoligenens harbinense (strain DSM 18485 / JCM 12961 / CGMCC 1.5033 / YUAN-3) TaxID=663278 RepID=E6U8G2_ETHHY|nr:serine--tRNA ligase [Ethanoligenens harbinense]ADU28281.1 seryl-tRNA synthetase [Ethanoligenens harbinense YUAN-3]AVQ97275.1 serine--tRNA ligase [Ethanoligenens harbinense YUAN-3]AYF39939.1 serine--tRNA ligase [Ethanoligenens harbinense]AYF42769.1 serine--tRNA ligase [Ethanoligenens harbinense]QCN93519.1 serine--tRNA ligase [Ethanoligenens harbinense]